jgi:tripartite-type tricarboxylate transporter receptor subunit TctC
MNGAMSKWRYGLASALLIYGATALAQDKVPGYPVRPIRIIIGVLPGAGADMVARATAQILTERWGQNAVVDPRPGGGGAIASELVSKSTPDGYTILQSGDGLLFQTATKRVPFDVLKVFEPVVSSTQQP